MHLKASGLSVGFHRESGSEFQANGQETRKCQMTQLAVTMLWDDQLMTACRTKLVTANSIDVAYCSRHATGKPSPDDTRRLSPQGTVDLLRDIWPMQFNAWSNSWVPVTTWVAAFSTRWSQSLVVFDDPVSIVLQPSTWDVMHESIKVK